MNQLLQQSLAHVAVSITDRILAMNTSARGAIAHAEDLSTLPEPLVAKVTAAREACSGFNDGEFSLEWGAIVRTELDGDPQLDWVLNEWGFAGSSAVSLYCGTVRRVAGVGWRSQGVAVGPACSKAVARCSQADIGG